MYLKFNVIFFFVRSLVAACSQGDIGRVRRLLDEVNISTFFNDLFFSNHTLAGRGVGVNISDVNEIRYLSNKSHAVN